MFLFAKLLLRCSSLNGRRLAKGFSLVEIMVGVAIIGLVTAVALPSFSEWIRNVRIRSAAEAVLAGVQVARTEAIRRNTPVVFTLLPAADATLLWRVGCVTVTATCPASIHTRPLREGGLLTSGGAMTVSFDAGADTQVRFDSFGRATNLAGASAWNVESSDSYSGERPQRILVDVGGSSRVCDPYLSASVLGSCP
jgi:type IV fimbrial biogenesis protein FimT